ncbi:MAG: MFS transporter [Hyphomicrobiales bacterium]|nr:MFS transporter [Hyphomicrobiales bacterium]
MASPLARFLFLYVALYAAFGVISPFLPQFLSERGLTPEVIGWIASMGTAVRLIAGPVAARLADRHRSWRVTLCVCALAAGAAVLLYLPSRSPMLLVLVSVLQAAALAPLVPVADALAVSGPCREREGFSYGALRGAGSAAFIAAVIVAGHIGASGLASTIWLNASLLAIAAIAALPLPDIASRASKAGGSLQDVRVLLAVPQYRRLLLVAALILGSHALHDTFAIIRWRAAGIDTQTAGLLWCEAVAAEVLVFFLVGPALLHRLGSAGAAALAAVAGIVRWAAMASTTGVGVLLLVQPLHGLTFALLHLAAMHLIGAIVPPALAATAQAVYGTLAVGAATAALAFASGWLYAWLGGAAFWAMALLCAAALPLVPGLRDSAGARDRATTGINPL